MPSHRRLTNLAAIALAILAGVGCAAPPAGDVITADAAKAAAALSATSSVPVTVTSVRLSTFGAEASGVQVVPAATPVWAVEVTGSFPVSCGPAPPPSVTKVCPPPLTTQLVLIDARTGAFLFSRSPARTPG